MGTLVVIWTACSIMLVSAIAWRWLADRRRLTLLEAALQTGSEPMLIFDDRSRLAYLSPGLVIFDRQEVRRLSSHFGRPARGSEERGEVEIDGNRYLYRSKLLEYKPGRFGLVVWLEYRRSTAAN